MGLSFNYPFELGDSNGAIKSDIAQLKQDVGDLSQLETADKSSLVNALNEAIDSTLNGASKDLDNLSDDGNDKLYSLNAYKNEGSLLHDTKGLECVTAYSRSTFDRSKFTAEGSPNITDDGIASGFSSSNYLDITSKITSLTKSFKVKSRFTYQVAASTQNIFGLMNTNTNNWTCLSINSSGDLRFTVAVGGTAQHLAVSSSAFTSGKTYDCECWQDADGTMHMKYKALDEDIWHTPTAVAQSLVNLTSVTSARIGQAPHNTSEAFSGSIDLKQFSITVDGVPYFSGNKTGIDTIKPNDYTVVGTPTISADGIASGFSSSNRITASNILPTSGSHNYVFEIKFNSDTNTTATRYIFMAAISGNTTKSPALGCMLRNTGKISCVLFNSTTGENAVYDVVNFAQNTDYKIKVETDLNTFLKVYVNGNLELNQSVSYNNTFSVGDLNLGVFQGYSSGGNITYNLPLTKGSIDLNTFEVYVDGNLVYQPCLKIPYTESKTGSKIVDSIYRDRVNDMAEQFGFANYYTLSDTDFTLPQIELYGLIGQRTLRDSYRNGINYWELYSNRDLEQGGSCTSGVEVTFPKPFADTNYVLSVPYSAKSTTAFTPTQTGDWIAKGKGIL